MAESTARPMEKLLQELKAQEEQYFQYALQHQAQGTMNDHGSVTRGGLRAELERARRAHLHVESEGASPSSRAAQRRTETGSGDTFSNHPLPSPDKRDAGLEEAIHARVNDGDRRHLQPTSEPTTGSSEERVIKLEAKVGLLQDQVAWLTKELTCVQQLIVTMTTARQDKGLAQRPRGAEVAKMASKLSAMTTKYEELKQKHARQTVREAELHSLLLQRGLLGDSAGGQVLSSLAPASRPANAVVRPPEKKANAKVPATLRTARV